MGRSCYFLAFFAVSSHTSLFSLTPQDTQDSSHSLRPASCSHRGRLRHGGAPQGVLGNLCSLLDASPIHWTLLIFVLLRLFSSLTYLGLTLAGCGFCDALLNGSLLCLLNSSGRGRRTRWEPALRIVSPVLCQRNTFIFRTTALTCCFSASKDSNSNLASFSWMCCGLSWMAKASINFKARRACCKQERVHVHVPHSTHGQGDRGVAEQPAVLPSNLGSFSWLACNASKVSHELQLVHPLWTSNPYRLLRSILLTSVIPLTWYHRLPSPFYRKKQGWFWTVFHTMLFSLWGLIAYAP